MTPLAAHVACTGLMAAGFVARALRIQWILRGLGTRVTVGQAVTLNAFGDAACAVTPLRLGGEPARLGGMLRARVPAAAAFVAISLEVLAAWPVIIAAAAALMFAFAPAWWADAGPRLVGHARQAWPWIVVVVVFTLLAWIAARRLKVTLVRQLRRPLLRARVYWRRMPLWPLIASAPLTLIDLVSRVAVLPLLASTLPDAPAAGPLWLGSFGLLYVQLLLPTPSGAGVVDLGFLGGAAGELGRGEGALLLEWRFYTNGIGLVLGAWLALRIYGWPAVRHAITRVAGR